MFGRDRPAPASLPDHGAVRKADPFSFQVAHRRLAWMLRLSVALNVVLASGLTASFTAFAALFPLKETEIALVRHYEPDARLYRIEPIQQDVEGFDVLMESMARRYVMMLLEIDPVTQDERLRQAFVYSDDALYRRFRAERIETGELRRAIESGLVRSIHVEAVERLQSLRRTYKYAVDFVQRDMRAGQVIEERRRRALLTMTTRPSEVRAEDKYENPLGITVLDLALKERDL